jgi:hypothetical protein
MKAEGGNLWLNVGNLFSSKTITNNLPELNFKFNSGNEDLEAGDNDNASLLSKVKSNIKDTIEVQTSYKSFFITLAIGLVFIFLSLIFLPLVAISPYKFLFLFSTGSVIIVASFIFIYGTSEYFQMLFSKERFIFTIFYIVSILLGIYSGFIKEYYILSLICVLVQMTTLIIFVLSFIPGGKSGITFILNMLATPIKNLFNKS